jgi:hypothetical protein
MAWRLPCEDESFAADTWARQNGGVSSHRDAAVFLFRFVSTLTTEEIGVF